MTERAYTPIDQIVSVFDRALHTLFAPHSEPSRPNPAAGKRDDDVTSAERELAGRLMRINHAGEICAQALYQGQAVTARLPTVREKMEQAASEENDHLAWTAERIRECGTHLSYLNPVWYTGSFAIGALAGLVGDRWSLGFVAETERQVVLHLESHLAKISPNDFKSRAILEQMRDDEARHATVAIESGAATFPEPIKRLMQLTSRVMTETTYWV